MQELCALALLLVQTYATGALMLIGFAFILGGSDLAGRAGRATLKPVIALGELVLAGIASSTAMLWQVVVRVASAMLVYLVDPLLVVLRRVIAAVLFPRR